MEPGADVLGSQAGTNTKDCDAIDAEQGTVDGECDAAGVTLSSLYLNCSGCACDTITYPTIAPTISGAPTVAPTNSTGPALEFGYLAQTLFDEQCLIDKDGRDAVAEFMTDLLDGLRFESICGTGLGYISLMMLLMLGGIPSIDNPVSAFMWTLWMLCVLAQVVFTTLAEVAFILAYASLESQYRDCMVEFSHGHALFNVILPVMLFHPAFISRTLAVFAYCIALGLGLVRAKVISSLSSEAFGPCVYYSAGIFIGPGALVGCFYFIFTLTVLFVVAFFLPMSISLLALAAVAYAFLLVVLFASNKCSEYLKNEDSDSIVRKAGVAKILHKFILRQVDSMLWWISPNAEGGNGMPVNLFFGVPIVVGLAAAPLCIFGTWLAFYVYLGDHSTDEHMEFVREAYQHVFKIFTYKVSFALPIFRFDLSLLEDFGSLLSSFPDLTIIPPYKLLEASFACTAMSFLLGLIKPVVSGMAAALAFFAEMEEGNQTVEEVLGHETEMTNI